MKSSTLISEIKETIANPQVPDEFLVDLANEYREACANVNARLVQVSKLINSGYLDEAVQIAERSPKLLEQFTLVDLPERESWINLLRERSMDLPPDLSTDLATDLEQAYEKMRILEPQLRLHRKLALSHAPLNARINTLNKLCQLDPENPVWPEDCEMLQRARLVEIHQDYKNAKSRGDLQGLKEINEELQKPWRIPIPKSLKTGVKAALENLDGFLARDQLKEIGKKLNQHLLAFEDDLARPLRNQWNELSKVAKLSPGDRLAESVREALAWLDEMDAEAEQKRGFDQSVKQLEQALEKQVPLHELDRRMYEVQKYEKDISEALYIRTINAREKLVLASRRSSRLRLLVGGTICAILAIVTGWLVVHQSSRRLLADARSQMETFVAQAAFDPGLKYYENLAPNLKQDGEVARLHAKLVNGQSSEKERLVQLDGLLNGIKFDGSLGAELNDAIQTARQLAATDAERNQIKILENQLNTNRLKRQATRTEEFLNKLQGFRSSLESLVLQSGTTSTIREIEVQCHEVQKLLDRSSGNVDGMAFLTSAAEQNANLLIDRGKAKIRELEEANQALVAIRELPQKLENLAGYSNALQVFSHQFQNDSNANEFAKTSREQPFWLQFQQWQKLADVIESIDLLTITSAEAEKYANELKVLLSQDFVFKDVAASTSELESFLEMRIESKKALPNIDLLKTTFEKATFRNIHVLQRGNEQYYLSKALEANNKSKEFNYLFDQSTTRSSKTNKDDLIGLAPHCEIAQKVTGVLASIDPERLDVEDLVVKVLECLAERPKGNLQADPLVLVEFADQILLFAKLSTPALEQFANNQRAKIKSDNLVGNDWLAMTDDMRKEPRGKARLFLESLAKETTEKRKELADRIQKLDALKAWTSIKEYKIAGLVFRDQDNWLINSLGELADDTTVYSIIPTTKKEYTVREMGKYRFGRLDQTGSTVSAQAGRIVLERSNLKTD